MPEIENIKKEYEDILNQLSDPELISDFEKFQALSQRKNFLEKIIEKDREIQEIKNKIEENKAILSAREDAELFSLAQEELISFREKQKSLELELAVSLEADVNTAGRENSSAVIIEIRAGTGGQEAALFAGDLFRMYSKYAEKQNWNQKILDSHPSELNGFKEIIFELKSANGGGDVFSKMKYEAGVHRVQRIPETEKQERVHTSTASVAVLLKPKKTQIKINPQDLRIDFYRASGKGGQNVNKRETAVRITHLPTGIIVTCQSERFQGANRKNAEKMLFSKLYQLQQENQKKELAGIKGDKISASWGNQIRNYVLHPYKLVKDTRTGLESANPDEILDGDLDEFIDAEIKL